MVASCTPCVASFTCSRSGQRVAFMRRRRSARSSSGKFTLKGRMAVLSVVCSPPRCLALVWAMVSSLVLIPMYRRGSVIVSTAAPRELLRGTVGPRNARSSKVRLEPHQNSLNAKTGGRKRRIIFCWPMMQPSTNIMYGSPAPTSVASSRMVCPLDLARASHSTKVAPYFCFHLVHHVACSSLLGERGAGDAARDNDRVATIKTRMRYLLWKATADFLRRE